MSKGTRQAEHRCCVELLGQPLPQPDRLEPRGRDMAAGDAGGGGVEHLLRGVEAAEQARLRPPGELDQVAGRAAADLAGGRVGAGEQRLRASGRGRAGSRPG